MQARTALLLEQLKKICASINEQIPLAANRFTEFECAPREADQDEVKRRSLVLKKMHEEARCIYFAYQYLNDQFKQFLHDNNLQTPLKLTAPQREAVTLFILQAMASYCQKLTRLTKYVDMPVSAEQIEAYIKTQLEACVDQLQQGKWLTLENADLEKRFHLNEELAQLRETIQIQLHNNQLFRETLQDEHSAEIVQKMIILWRGVYVDQICSRTGFCDEQAALGLKRILETYELQTSQLVDRIERVSLQHEGGDGHVFLAINRNPLGRLNNISSWGENAILFDPWNQLVCMASEFDTLPLRYFSYPASAQWSTFKFELADSHLLMRLSCLTTYLHITDSFVLEKRLPRLMEEYELHDLAMPALAKTQAWLENMLASLIPSSLTAPIKLMLTTGGNQYVSCVAGFPYNVIAIHRDFLMNIQPGKNTVEELCFALTVSVLQVKEFGVGLYESLKAEQRHRLDKAALEQTQNGEAAIRYLRSCIAFSKQPDESVRLPNVAIRFSGILPSYEQRIKNILMLLAEAPYLQKANMATTLPPAVSTELSEVKACTLFKSEIDSKKTKVEKIRALTQCLPQLKEELYPFEYCWMPSKRVRDFITLIKTIEIDWNNLYQVEAVDELINQADNLRIPTFDLIYLAVCNKKYSSAKPNKKLCLPALGKFKKLQQLFNAFIAAGNEELASKIANLIETTYADLQHHFTYPRLDFTVKNHAKKYYEQHGKVPTGNGRYFGSWIGKHIAWQASSGNLQAVNRHISWAIDKNNITIARMLWRLGVVSDQRYWSVIPASEWMAYLKANATPILNVDKVCSYLHFEIHQGILTHVSARHILNDKMLFDTQLSFEQKFIAFYEANYLALICPADNHNIDNSSVKTLLRWFAVAACSGTEKEKQIVKSFFLGRSDQRDLAHLRKANPHREPRLLPLFSHYARFLLEGKFSELNFSLFTKDEALPLLAATGLPVNDIPAAHYVRLFHLPYRCFSLDCLAALFSLLEKYAYRHCVHSNLLEEHVKLNPPYALFSPAAVQLMRLAKQYIMLGSRFYLKSAIWILPANLAASRISLEDLIFLYRSIDTLLAFPSHAERYHFSCLLLNAITVIPDNAYKCRLIESMLFVFEKNNKCTPLSHIELRNSLIKQWAEAMLSMYGRDDDSQTYADKLKLVIKRAYEGTSQRDTEKILAELANKIEAQSVLCDYIGELLNPALFLVTKKDPNASHALTTLAAASRLLGEEKQDQIKCLNFLSTPITEETVRYFANYLIEHKKARKFSEAINPQNEYISERHELQLATETALQVLYFLFWDCSIEKRAVVIDHLLMPASSVKSHAEMQQAYEEGFNYVSGKLFSATIQPDSDEAVALDFLRAYLATASQEKRGLLLAGLLVATNETQAQNNQVGIGKRLALLCEHLGPAYVKIAQAIHSYPETPASIRDDLVHVKSRANPPERWHLWRLLTTVVPVEYRQHIRRLGRLLGSASYNLALEVEWHTGEVAVLSLLRENAAKDAQAGFVHLGLAVRACKHSRMMAIQSTILAMITEAESLSAIEMDYIKSQQQFALAEKLYQLRIYLSDQPAVHFTPSQLLAAGPGYRFITKMPGEEFNEKFSRANQATPEAKAIAKAVLVVELINLLRGDCFDSDRHGNQLRLLQDRDSKTWCLGLYDFGEMSLVPPTIREIQHLADIIQRLPALVLQHGSLTMAIDKSISAQIASLEVKKESTQYFLHIRKAWLALQDFQQHLTGQELIELLFSVKDVPGIHPVLQQALTTVVTVVSWGQWFLRDKMFDLTHVPSLRVVRLSQPASNCTQFTGTFFMAHTNTAASLNKRSDSLPKP